jgi:hypothetical protein
VTLFPRSIVPDIGPMDFDKGSFSTDRADKTILDMCRVDQRKGAEFAGLDRATFRDRYFDAHRDLKTEFIEFNNNAAFVAEAIDHGFFVIQGDVTGRVRLGEQ